MATSSCCQALYIAWCGLSHISTINLTLICCLLTRRHLWPIFCKSSLHSIIHASYLFLHQQMLSFLFCRNGGCLAFLHSPHQTNFQSIHINKSSRRLSVSVSPQQRDVPSGEKVFLINSIFQPPYNNFPYIMFIFQITL